MPGCAFCKSVRLEGSHRGGRARVLPWKLQATKARELICGAASGAARSKPTHPVHSRLRSPPRARHRKAPTSARVSVTAQRVAKMLPLLPVSTLHPLFLSLFLTREQWQNEENTITTFLFKKSLNHWSLIRRLVSILKKSWFISFSCSGGRIWS